MRSIPDIPVERAELRLTATYAVMDGAFVGVEYNPLDDDVGLLANWRIVDETARRPMVMVGTSSDRIGTTSGRAYYSTVSKSFGPWASISIAPYAGVSYGEFDEEWVGIGGMSVFWTRDISSTTIWDGHNLHHMLNYSIDNQYLLGFVLAEQDGKHHGGVTLGWTF